MRPERILVLDALARQSLAACRALGRAGYDVAAAGHAATALAGLSRYTARYHQLPSPFEDGQTFIEALEHVIDEFGYTALIATDDATLARLNHRPPSILSVPSLGEPFSLLTDKLRLGELARLAGVDYPETYPADTPEQLEAALGAAQFPAIVKSERSGVVTAEKLAWVSGATVVYDSAAAREAAAALLEKGLRPIVQERVRWTEKMNVVIIRRDGRSELRYAHRVLKENPPDGGMGITLETLHPSHPSAARSLAALERVCDAAGYQGLAQAELYLSEERAWLIDVNPRLWGSAWFAERLGLKVSERALRAVLGQPELPDAAVYPAGKRFHHVQSELRWISRRRPAWRSFLDVVGSYRLGDYVEYIDWSDLRPLLLLVRARVAGLGRLLPGR